MNKEEYAIELKHNGHNCAQAVLCAFTEETKTDADLMRKIGSAFGSGMGNMEGTCGALCGAEIVLGLLKYEGRGLHRDAADLYSRFTGMCKASLCKDIKGRDTGVVLCSCDDCVRNAVKLIEDIIK